MQHPRRNVPLTPHSRAQVACDDERGGGLLGLRHVTRRKAVLVLRTVARKGGGKLVQRKRSVGGVDERTEEPAPVLHYIVHVHNVRLLYNYDLLQGVVYDARRAHVSRRRITDPLREPEGRLLRQLGQLADPLVEPSWRAHVGPRERVRYRAGVRHPKLQVVPDAHDPHPPSRLGLGHDGALHALLALLPEHVGEVACEGRELLAKHLRLVGLEGEGADLDVDLCLDSRSGCNAKPLLEAVLLAHSKSTLHSVSERLDLGIRAQPPHAAWVGDRSPAARTPLLSVRYMLADALLGGKHVDNGLKHLAGVLLALPPLLDPLEQILAVPRKDVEDLHLREAQRVVGEGRCILAPLLDLGRVLLLVLLLLIILLASVLG
mmetsp:Transcript_28563/g.70687  ORF Transcript_28563/g.70687 Transcript_28563/m.70687 type:complete len:376 (+) Transcript_28563:456-1583(+)